VLITFAVGNADVTLKESLLETERQLWHADEERYEQTLSEAAVMVFPEPTGVLERSEILDSLGGADRWSTVEFTEEQLVEASDDVVQLVYRATATDSADGSEYRVLVTSTYVRHEASWRLLSHQQTPATG
jgi:ketosteroid isomerase-like protein